MTREEMIEKAKVYWNNPEGNSSVEEHLADFALAVLEEERGKTKKAMDAAFAYSQLATCYRIGRNPSEALFKRLAKADKLLNEHSAAEEASRG